LIGQLARGTGMSLIGTSDKWRDAGNLVTTRRRAATADHHALARITRAALARRGPVPTMLEISTPGKSTRANHPMEPSMEGGCTCRQVRYRLIGTPLIVHACHCRWCQRETGTAHALNALYEADRVAHIAGEPEIVVTPSASGEGQRIARCPTCRVAVWSKLRA
jgi:hypothetical protein